MRGEALVLDGNGRMNEIKGNIVIGDPNAVLRAIKLLQLMVFPRLGVGIIDDRGLRQRDIVQLQPFGIFLGLRDDILLDIALEFRQEDRTGDRSDECDGADSDQQHKDDLAQHVEHGPRDAPGQMRLLFLLRLSCHDNSSVLREAPHPTDRRKNP